MPGIAGVAGAHSDAAAQALLGRMMAAMTTRTMDVVERLPAPGGPAALRGCAVAVAGLPLHTHLRWDALRLRALLVYGHVLGAAGGPADLPGALDALLVDDEVEASVAALNGWFAAVRIDFRTGRLDLFNDRYGLGRVHWHEARDGCLYFASQARCIQAVAARTHALAERSLAEQFALGAVLQERSLFREIALLPPASSWRFAAGRWHRGTYFDRKSWESQPALDAARHADALEQALAGAVRRHVRPDDKPGMSLTGGLDGRMIMAWAKAAPGSLPCYTFAGPYRASADVRIARRIALACHQSHHAIVVDERFLANFAQHAQACAQLCDGTMDASGAVELYVNECATQIAPVRVTGSYGSEILRGNVAFKPQAFAEGLLDPGFDALLGEAARTYYDERANCHPLSFIVFKQIPWFHQPRFALETARIALRLPFLDNDLVAALYRAPPGGEAVDALSWKLIARGNPALAAIPTDRGQGSVRGLRGRFERARATLAFKAEYAYDLGMPHRFARLDARLRPLRLERLFLGRHKFYHFRIWYRDRLARHLRETLLGGAVAGMPWMQRGAVERMVRLHTSGQANYTQELHQLLGIELTCRNLPAAWDGLA